MEKFQIRQMRDGQYYFNLKASNGEILISSEGYTSKSGCLAGVESVKSNALNEGHFIEKTSSDKRHYFNLKSRNGQIIATSQMYSSLKAMLNGIEAVMKYAPSARLDN